MSYPTYYAMMPQPSWPASVSLRALAQNLCDAVAVEKSTGLRKARLVAELEFIRQAAHVVLLSLRDPCVTPETIVELAEEIGTMLGEQAYDGSNPDVALTWASECLEMAGVGKETERQLFDDDDAEQMVFVPQEAFDSVLHEVEEQLRGMLREAKEIIEREPLPFVA